MWVCRVVWVFIYNHSSRLILLLPYRMANASDSVYRQHCWPRWCHNIDPTFDKACRSFANYSFSSLVQRIYFQKSVSFLKSFTLGKEDPLWDQSLFRWTPCDDVWAIVFPLKYVKISLKSFLLMPSFFAIFQKTSSKPHFPWYGFTLILSPSFLMTGMLYRFYRQYHMRFISER